MLDELPGVVCGRTLIGIFITALFVVVHCLGMIGIKWLEQWDHKHQLEVIAVFKKAILLQIGLGLIAILIGLIGFVTAWFLPCKILLYVANIVKQRT